MNLWNCNKSSKIHVTRIPEGEGKEGKAEKELKCIMAGSFPKLAKGTSLQIKKSEQILTRTNKKIKNKSKIHHSQTSGN